MLHPDNIPEMETVLEKRGVPVAQLCEKAGIAKTTWWRWRERRASPNFETWDGVVKAYETLIDAPSDAAGVEDAQPQ